MNKPTERAHTRALVWARAYQRLLLILFALSPLPLIIYLQLYQDPGVVFHSHWFHELAIAVAIVIGAAVTVVAAICYRDSGEPMLRWLTLALMGFTLVYAPHGILTRLAADNPPLFLLYGPASRMVLAAFLLIGLLYQQAEPDSASKRSRVSLWLPWLVGIILLDVAIAMVALNPAMPHGQIRFVMEGAAELLSAAALVVLLAQPRISPLLLFFAGGICFFAQSSISFFLASPWNHQWWLAHGIFAAGFMMMSFGLIRAFLTTRSLVAVFSTEQWMQQVLEANERAEQAIGQLNESNRQLETLANTDALTGLPNRRRFMTAAQEAMTRAVDKQSPLSVMILDLDHFKQINDSHGHDVGDRVLCAFAGVLNEGLRHQSDPQRPRRNDLVGRIGGEEFAVVIPDAAQSGARFAAERVRKLCQALNLTDGQGQQIAVSASIGVAHYPADGQQLSDLLAVADQRLYCAKAAGRNRVQAA